MDETETKDLGGAPLARVPLTDTELADLREMIVTELLGCMLDAKHAPYVQRLVNAYPRMQEEIRAARAFRAALGLKIWPSGEEIRAERYMLLSRKNELITRLEAVHRDGPAALHVGPIPHARPIKDEP